ncbi:MAG: hypothetical protein EAX86_00985 [Candidatus Heimdallarchaeota archaeon]|nr:hypothetical protein [Candidatus Heimdallarchaeota archaeon]
MSPKKIIVQSLSCLWNPDTPKNNVGFQVSGYKSADFNKRTQKVGFILSGVRIIAFQQLQNVGVRTRVKWIPEGFEIREESHPLDGRIVDIQNQNNVVLVNQQSNSAIIMQGEPRVQQNTFIGQIIRVQWDGENIEVFSNESSLAFHCTLIPRNNRIDCVVR